MALSGSVRASRPYSIFCSVDLSFESIRTNCKKHLALLDDAVFRMLDLLDLTAAMLADYELLTEQLWKRFVPSTRVYRRFPLGQEQGPPETIDNFVELC